MGVCGEGGAAFQREGEAMSKYLVTVTRCDGCGKIDVHDGVIFPLSYTLGYPEEKKTVDICEHCYEADKFFCWLCEGVHDDQHPCDQMMQMMQMFIDETKITYCNARVTR